MDKIEKAETSVEKPIETKTNPNRIFDLLDIAKEGLPTFPDKVYRGVRGREAIDDLDKNGVVRNKQSAGLTAKGSRWGERVYWSRGAIGKFQFVSKNEFIIEAPLAVAETRLVTKKDVTAIYTRNEKEEIVDILGQQRIQEKQKENDRKKEDEEKLKEIRKNLGIDKQK